MTKFDFAKIHFFYNRKKEYWLKNEKYFSHKSSQMKKAESNKTISSAFILIICVICVLIIGFLAIERVTPSDPFNSMSLSFRLNPVLVYKKQDEILLRAMV